MNIFVLQHSGETKNPKGTAVIASLSLQNYRCWVGEDFSRHEGLNQLIARNPENTFVVFPDNEGLTLQNISGVNSSPVTRQRLNLIFIDATWRKAKKIYMSSQNLQLLPKVIINTQKPSTYRIRKIPEDGYLSTIEAVTYSLMVLEQDEEKYQPLLDVFNKLINHQIEKMGIDTYKRNYANKLDD